MNELLYFVKHPYAAGVIAVSWIAGTIRYWIDRDLPIVQMVMINMVVSFIIALIGFKAAK